MGTDKNNTKILFIGKADHVYARIAADFLKVHFENPLIIFSSRKDPFPDALYQWKGDLLISYLAQWIIPDAVLKNASIAAVNLHPGPPEYPGIGCTNFAIYNGEKEFGITCHHMLGKVDSGNIITVKRFPVFETDSVYSLTQRCYVEILHAFLEMMYGFMQGKQFAQSSESWKRKPYTRKQLNALCELTKDMAKEEVDRRMKATTYGDKVWAHYIDESAGSIANEIKSTIISRA